MPSCFLCGAEGPVRQVEVATAAVSSHGDVHQHLSLRELKPLCATCAAKRDAERVAAVTVGLARVRALRRVGVTIATMVFALALGIAAWFTLVD